MVGCRDRCAEEEKEVLGFYQWETATLTIHIGGVKDVFVDTRDIVFSIMQGATELAFHKADLVIDEENNLVSAHLSQEDTGKFRVGPNGRGKASVQLNVFYDDAERDATGEGEITILRNLYRQVME